MLTPEDIRYATTKQLARVFGVHEPRVSAWTTGGSLRDSSLDRACSRFGVSKEVLLQGIELRRRDYQRRLEVAERLRKLLKGERSSVA